MNRILINIVLIITLFSGLLGFTDGVKAQCRAEAGGTKSEHQIKQNEGNINTWTDKSQSPIETAFRSTSYSNHNAFSRSTRLLPTHGGGKSGGNNSRWIANECLTPFKSALLQSCNTFDRYHVVVVSPRLRYIIALRHLLC